MIKQRTAKRAALASGLGRWFFVLLLVLSLGLLSACTQIPTSGPVVPIGKVSEPDPKSWVNVAAQPPKPGANIETIIEGFFSAAEAGSDDYAVARQYLTPSAAAAWHPEYGILIYDSATQSKQVTVTSDGNAVLSANVVGRVDEKHHYTSAFQADYRHDFFMTKIDGEWRIGNPGRGLIISQRRFERAFGPVVLFFLDPMARNLVPEQIFLRRAGVTTDQLMRALIAGPSKWLRPAVVTAIPAELTTSGSYLENGVVHVSLSQEIEQLSAELRVQAAAQILATMSYFDNASGLQITSNGRVLSIDTANQDGVVRTEIYRFLDRARPAAQPFLYVVKDNKVEKLADDGLTDPVPLTGFFAKPLSQAPRDLAVSWTADRIALVSKDGDEISIVNTFGTGEKVNYQGKNLANPTFDANAMLWTVDNQASQPKLVKIYPNGQTDSYPIPELTGKQVLSFNISPDGARVALIYSINADEEALAMLRIKDDEHMAVDGFRRIQLPLPDGPLTKLRDVAFTAPLRLVVLGASARDAGYSVYSLDVDAANIVSQGPLTDLGPTKLVVLPQDSGSRIVLATNSGRLLRFESQFRWTNIGGQVSAVAYPS